MYMNLTEKTIYDMIRNYRLLGILQKQNMSIIHTHIDNPTLESATGSKIL